MKRPYPNFLKWKKKKKKLIGAFYQTVRARKECAQVVKSIGHEYPVQKSLKIHHFIKDLTVIIK